MRELTEAGNSEILTNKNKDRFKMKDRKKTKERWDGQR